MTGRPGERAAGARARAIRFAVAAAVVAIVAAGLTTTVSAAACDERGRIEVLGRWTEIAAPEFGSIPASIAAYEVDPVDPNVIFVTNGTEVLRSPDGGCHWTKTFDLAAVSPVEFPGFAAGVSTIRDVVVPDSGAGRDTVYLSVAQAEAASYVVVSTDGGLTWSAGNGGAPVAPGAPSSLAAAPADPETVYLNAELPSGMHDVYRSVDGGRSWEPMTLAAPPPEQGLQRGTPGPWISVDPVDSAHVWAWGATCVCRSTDGGRTFASLLTPPSNSAVGVVALDVFRAGRGAPRLLAFTAAQTFYRSDDGGRTWQTGNVPDPVTFVVHGKSRDEIVAATNQTASRAVVAYDPEGVWQPISLGSFPLVTDLSTSGTSRPTAFGNAEGRALLKYSGPFAAQSLDLDVFTVPPGRPSATIEKCPPPGPRADWKRGWDPAPANEPVYVTNFLSGHTIRYDSHGTGTVVAIAPRYSEGMVLDPLGRLVSTTRFTNQVTRLHPETCKLEVLDYDLFYAEGPTYDAERNLYVVNTNQFYIWKYPWPQHPRQQPTLVWRMPGFLEDLKIAPPTSPWAGHMFVLYRDRSRDVDDPRACGLTGVCVTGLPNAVAILKPTKNPKFEGWRRLPQDFVSFANVAGGGECGGFGALGIALLPDGRLLVPDACGSGVIRAYSPDGESFSVFARVDPGTAEPLYLAKIAATASGHVYVTGNNSFCGPGENSASWVFRFDGEGREQVPPFTQHLDCAVGVAAPPAFPIPPVADPDVPVPDDPVPEPPAVDRPEPAPVRGAAVAPPPPPPPPLIVPAPVPGPAPITELAPAPAPNPAPAQAANPMAAAVAQEQEQPQMAFVVAAHTVREQVGEQFAMARVARTNDPLAPAKFVLVSASLAAVAALGYVSLALSRARSRVRIRSSPR